MFEYRADPLTERNTTAVKGMLNYIGRLLVSNNEQIALLAEKTRVNCPFCPENVKNKTPIFPPDFLKEGRILMEEAVVVPNILGYAERSENFGTSYWADLISAEKGGERYLFEADGVEWPVLFAPLRGLNEVEAIIRGKSTILEISEEEWREIANGMAKILSFYYKEGYVSFNAVLLSGPVDKHLDYLDYFDVSLKIISRSGIQASSITDAWALHICCGTERLWKSLRLLQED